MGEWATGVLISALFPKGEPRQPGTRQITFPRSVLHPCPILGVKVVELTVRFRVTSKWGKKKEKKRGRGGEERRKKEKEEHGGRRRDDSDGWISVNDFFFLSFFSARAGNIETRQKRTSRNNDFEGYCRSKRYCVQLLCESFSEKVVRRENVDVSCIDTSSLLRGISPVLSGSR